MVAIIKFSQLRSLGGYSEQTLRAVSASFVWAVASWGGDCHTPRHVFCNLVDPAVDSLENGSKHA
jgi:hypothetical protein